MPIYVYKAKRGPTEITIGEIEAESQEAATGKLTEMGLFPMSVAEKQGSEKAAALAKAEGAKPAASPLGEQSQKAGLLRPLRGLAMTDKSASAPAVSIRVRARDLDTFTHQLSSLVKASVPMLRALSLISEQTESRPLKRVVADLERGVRDGKLLSEAMEMYPNLFDGIYISLVKAGEKAGSLDEILQRVAAHRERNEELRRKIQAALAYPALMIAVGVLTIFIMFTYFLPKLMGLFENMKQTLPLPTRLLMSISGFLSNNWHWFLIFAVIIGVFLGRIRPGSRRGAILDIFELKVPFIKRFVINTEIAKFTRTLAMLLRNGIPVYESLSFATHTLDNAALRKSLEQVAHEIVNQGSTLSGGLAKRDIFPKFVVNMMAVGEEGGKLDEALAEIANTYEKEIEQAIRIISTLLEPLLILVIGAVVGFIVFALLLPIFDIGIMPR